MAIPNDYIDKITNKDSGESRIISPAADKVRVDNENFEGTDLDEVLDEVAESISEHHGLVNGRVPFDVATPIVLASLDGDNTDITPYSEGDYFAVISTEKIYQVVNGAADEVGEIDDKLIYCDKSDSTLYRWNGSQFVQVGGNSGGGDGTVTGVKVGSTTYEPTDGVVDLSTPFGGKVDKNGTDSLMTAAEHTKLQNLPTNEQLIQQFGSKANDADVVKSISVNGGQAQTPTQGNVNIVVPSGGLTESDISVETQGDGTVDINVGSDTYTINLNHTHEDMAKIVKCTEATLPQTLENDTIYVQVDNATTPSEIESLWLFGLEFTGGGFAPGTPRIVHPSGNTQINIGDTTSGSVSYTLNIKAKDLTQSLIVEFGSGSTGYSFDTTNLPSGVSYDSGTGKLTITKEAACNINGVDIVVVYTGSDTDENAEGTLCISSSSVDGINVVVPLIANKVSYEVIADWEGSSVPSGSNWIDEINNIPIGLYGTAAKISDGYRLNNTSGPKTAWCYPPTTQTSFFNTQIDKEFLCIIDCKVKFAAADKIAMVIDFGAFGDSRSGLSLSSKIVQNGTLESSFKKVSDSNAFSAKEGTAQTGISFPIDTYVDIHIKMGVHILRNGKQELFCECGSGRTYAVLDTPVTVNFAGINVGNPPNSAAFGLAVAYMKANDAATYAASYLSDVVYKKIQIFRK